MMQEFTQCRPILSCSLALAMVLMAGCAVGPDFQPPAAPDANAYHVNPHTGGSTDASQPTLAQQVFDRTTRIRNDWYKAFHSKKLVALIQQALANSPQLQSAQARIKAANALVDAAQGSLWPHLGIGLGVARKKASGIAFGIDNPQFINTFDLYEGTLSAGYNLDLFGGNKRRIENREALAQLQHDRGLNTYITLINNIVATAIAEAGTNASLDALNKIVKAQKSALKIVRKQVEYGAAIDTEVSQAKARLARTQARLEPLRKQRVLAVNRMAMLVGAEPGHFSDPDFQLADLHLPGQLPASMPAQLIAHRPDILAARARLHAASAQVGIASAALLPQFSIDASYGRAGLQLGDLTSPVTAIYSLGLNLAAPLFEGGTLRAKKHAAVAQYQAVLAEYHATVLAALADVANGLRSVESDGRALSDQKTALQAAQDNLQLTRKRLQQGAAGYLDLYTAQFQYQQSQLAYIKAQVTRFRDTALLFRALGGGWWNADQPPFALADNAGTDQ